MGGLRSRMRASPGGFTIVEVLVVVAVTGALFVSVVLLVAGRQQKAQFQQAVNNVTAQIETAINEAQSGYPGETVGCRNTGSTYTDTSPDSSCIFLGKAIQFTNGAANERVAMGIHTIVGKRDSTSVADAQPYTFVFERKPLWYDLQVISTNTQAAMLAFTLDYSQDADGTSRGTQGINIWRVTGAGLGNTFDTWKNRSLTGLLIANPTAGTRICLAHGGANAERSVLLTIGAGQSSRVQADIKTNGTCA